MAASASIIPSSELILGDYIAAGGMGKVFRAEWQHTQVAIKQLLVSDLSREAQEEFMQEADTMARLRHANVVQFFGISTDTRPFQLVMEYMPRGSLYGVLQESPPDLPRHSIARDTAAGVAYLHARNIIHRDLKSLNVLLDERYRAKLTDFGLATVKKETLTKTQQSVGSLLWMAPELFKRGVRPTPASDIYGLGMVFWEIASGKVPWSEAHSPQVVPMWVMQGDREEIPEGTDATFRGLIESCWAQDPEARPDADAVVRDLAPIVETHSTVSAGKAEAEVGAGAASGPQYDTSIASVPSAANISLRDIPGVTVFDEENWARYFNLRGLRFDDAPPLDLARAAEQLRCHLALPIEGDAGVTLLTLPRGLSFNKLVELAGAPREGTPARFTRFWSGIREYVGPTTLDRTYRVVVTNNVLIDTRSKSVADQEAVVGRVGARLPYMLEATALCVTRFVSTQLRLYGDDPRTYTRCEESVARNRVLVGNFSPTVLHVNYHLGANGDHIGAGAASEVL